MKDSNAPNPWITIWLQPRATIRRILDSDPASHVWFLGAAGGISQGLRAVYSDESGAVPELSLAAVVLISVTVGALSGLVGLLVMPYLLMWTGRWLGGEGSIVNLRASLAWSQVPGIWGLALHAVLIAFFGQQLLAGTVADSFDSGGKAAFFLIVTSAIAAIAIWQVFTTIKTVAEANGFSAWRAFFNLMLAGLAAVLFLLAVMLVVGMVSGTSG
ncbi:MAG: YIP1 family protein [Gammaproteobacteria bacterium]|nr:MAG: YIP1 family protein [Gammaproteobacteria bacterium]